MWRLRMKRWCRGVCAENQGGARFSALMIPRTRTLRNGATELVRYELAGSPKCLVSKYSVLEVAHGCACKTRRSFSVTRQHKHRNSMGRSPLEKIP
jgi:hypothetical protein